MNNGEAIQICERIKEGLLGDKPQEALNMAIKALEKQIPLVPVGDRKFTRCKCGRLANHYNYCPDCGQKFLKVGGQND